MVGEEVVEVEDSMVVTNRQEEEGTIKTDVGVANIDILMETVPTLVARARLGDWSTKPMLPSPT